MIDVNQLRRGVSFTQDGNLYKVTEYSHEIGYVFIGIGVLIVAFFIYKGMKKK